ncbi:MAG: ABC transporter ATP-binding protein [Deltaproteobacteria bacterium]|nr:ABC transporter ATP-binding protein [Deltaproteobacteria bacterium]
MIEVSQVTKAFGDIIAVDGISFIVEKGESVALLGPNGAGKSTLIRCILGTLNFDGDIKLNGLNIKNHRKESKALIGYVPQEPSFYDMTAMEILGFFASIRRVDRESIQSIMHIVGLKEHIHKNTSALSGGMRQRLSFAIALLSDSPILILDEPTSNLDAHGRAEFLRLVKQFKDGGKTVLFSSHRLEEVEFLADRAFVMKSGRLILESTPDNLSEAIGLKSRLHLTIPHTSINDALYILEREGFSDISLNGTKMSINIINSERILPLKKLLLSEIDVEDFYIEEPSLEEIMAEVKENGL